MNKIETENYIIETSRVLPDFITIKRKDGKSINNNLAMHPCLKEDYINGVTMHISAITECVTNDLVSHTTDYNSLYK